MQKAEKLTLILEPKAGDELRRWAAEEGRPIANLLRRIVARSLEQRRQHHEAAA